MTVDIELLNIRYNHTRGGRSCTIIKDIYVVQVRVEIYADSFFRWSMTTLSLNKAKIMYQQIIYGISFKFRYHPKYIYKKVNKYINEAKDIWLYCTNRECRGGGYGV